jgi:hypothetical protein
MTSKKKAVVETPQPKVIYIGPSIRGLNSYSVFEKGKYPAPVAELIRKFPSISGLIIPISGLQEARKNLTIKGHILNFYLTQLKTLKNKQE